MVRYDTGRVIVIRGADNKEITYTLAPSVAVPADVQVGRRVTLYTEPGKDGATQLVSRVTTTSVTSEGNVKRTTEDTRHLPSGATTLTTHTNISGKVAVYEAGKTLTITRFDGSKITYVINEKSQVPADLVIGKTVSIVPLATASGEPVVQTITYVDTTKTETVRYALKPVQNPASPGGVSPGLRLHLVLPALHGQPEGAEVHSFLRVHLDARPTANTLTRISPAMKPPTWAA